MTARCAACLPPLTAMGTAPSMRVRSVDCGLLEMLLYDMHRMPMPSPRSPNKWAHAAAGELKGLLAGLSLASSEDGRSGLLQELQRYWMREADRNGSGSIDYPSSPACCSGAPGLPPPFLLSYKPFATPTFIEHAHHPAAVHRMFKLLMSNYCLSEGRTDRCKNMWCLAAPPELQLLSAGGHAGQVRIRWRALTGSYSAAPGGSRRS